MTITLLGPAPGTVVALLNEQHKAYLAMPRAERVAYFADHDGRQEMKSAGYHPLPVSFSWQDNLPAGTEYTLKLATDADLSDARAIKTTERKATLDNLLIGTRYYWQVSAENDGQTLTSTVATFETEDQAPRLVRVENVPNVRDFGGWVTGDGRRVRQEMLYRTAGVNRCGGLNFYSREELETAEQLRPILARIRRTEADLRNQIAQLRERLEKGTADELVESTLGGEWTVFRPATVLFDETDFHVDLDSLTTIPEEFMGAAPEQAVAAADGCFIFPEVIPFAPAVFLQEFEAPADGYLQLGCGGDYFWDMRINGTKVYDKQPGNFTSLIHADNFIVQVPVRKGHNLMVVHVRSGAGGWAWCCADRSQVSEPDSRTVAEKMVAALEEAIDHIWQIPSGFRPAVSHLEESTLAYFRYELRIRSDIDLRNDYECRGMEGSPLKGEVTWFQCSFSSYQGMQSISGKEGFATVFRFLLDPANYPAIFHCAAGQDRTGALAFILNGLLGVAEEDLYLDWEATGFWNDNMDFIHDRRFDFLIGGFDSYPGKTIQDRIHAYVLDCGFTQEDIERFCEMMLE